MRFKLLSCEILYREMCAAIARSPNQVDVEFLPKGLHDMGAVKMLERLQSALDAIDPQRYDAVILGYALCGTGLVGLTARTVPFVVPRGHDCITLFMGSKERYLEYFNDHPGVFFKTTGWIERGEGLDQLKMANMGLGYNYQELVDKYGEENAKYIQEQLGDYVRHYRQMTFIEVGVEPDGSFEQRARDQAAERGWKFEKVAGDLSLVHRLLDGTWDEKDFLVVQPGYRLAVRHDESIMIAEKAE
jgi:hypothetical protein